MASFVMSCSCWGRIWRTSKISVLSLKVRCRGWWRIVAKLKVKTTSWRCLFVMELSLVKVELMTEIGRRTMYHKIRWLVHVDKSYIVLLEKAILSMDLLVLLMFVYIHNKHVTFKITRPSSHRLGSHIKTMLASIIVKMLPPITQKWMLVSQHQLFCTTSRTCLWARI